MPLVRKNIEETLDSEIVFQGKFFAIRRHQVILPNGKKAVREIAEHPGSCACVVLNENNDILLVKQYRKAAEAFLLEIPAGKINPGESPDVCVKREVEEETGVIIGQPVKLAEFFPSPGFTTEKMHLYKANQLSQGSVHQMADECIESHFVSFEEALGYVKTGEIRDAKTILGLLLVKEAAS